MLAPSSRQTVWPIKPQILRLAYLFSVMEWFLHLLEVAERHCDKAPILDAMQWRVGICITLWEYKHE